MIQCRSHEEGVRVCLGMLSAAIALGKKMSVNLFVGALVVLESCLWCAFLMRVGGVCAPGQVVIEVGGSLHTVLVGDQGLGDWFQKG